MGLVLRPSNVTSEFAWGINFELDFPKFLDIWVTEWFKSFYCLICIWFQYGLKEIYRNAPTFKTVYHLEIFDIMRKVVQN